MYQREINGFVFKLVGSEVEVLRNGRVVLRFPLEGAEDQKSFDKEIGFWYMEHANELC